ncbi:serine acetyltransferase [Enterococcus faecium]|nr:serine acetyltransferase [Enterococcus faecium]
MSYQTEIGDNCKFLYGGIGCVIGKDTKIGNHVIIGTNVLTGGRSNKPGMPTIGNNVYIATGAKILGNITIGDNVIVGANAVVINDVEPNCSVGGVPARVLKKDIDVNDYCSLNRY